MTDDRARCDGCWQLVPVWDLSLVMVQVCKQTHSSPAEYEERRVCTSCRTDDRDEAYERANVRYKDRMGSEL